MKLIGMETEVNEAYSALLRKEPVLFYGPTGNGKTLAAWEVANKLSKEIKRPVVYLQLYPEMTKNSLIGGETIKNGSIVVEEQAILKTGCGKGAIFIVDECTHTTEPVLLAFNSLIEEPFSTVVGDKIYKLSGNSRFLFCGNLPDHAGNIHLPISFANRLYIIRTGMPTKENLIAIGREGAPQAVPTAFLDFIADIILKCHEPAFPVSPRNMVAAVRSLSGTFGTGYVNKKGVPAKIDSVCKESDISPDRLRRAIMSSLMANIVATSTGPDKVAALLWE